MSIDPNQNPEHEVVETNVKHLFHHFLLLLDNILTFLSILDTTQPRLTIDQCFSLRDQFLLKIDIIFARHTVHSDYLN